MHEFNRDPWRKGRYRDKAYPSGTASARPMLTPRIHCAVDDPEAELEERDHVGNRCNIFNMQLRAGHGYRNEGEE